jgi:phosphinothricin acetyltransferase
MEARIRDATAADWEPVTEVYNYFIENSMAAYPDRPVEVEFFRARHHRHRAYPFLVVETGDGVRGFAYLSPYHFAATMRCTAALTYFLHPSITGRGIGTALLERLLESGRRMGITTFLANISSLNEGSLRFHRRHGFTECGRFLKVGRKAGRSFDMVWVQRIEA